MTVADINRQVAFAASPPDARGVRTVIIGVPRPAWNYMSGGKTHHFDLSRAGIPLQFVLFGGEDHDAIMRILNADMAAAGKAYVDLRREDFTNDVYPEVVEAGVIEAKRIGLHQVTAEKLRLLYRTMRLVDDDLLRARHPG